MPPPSLAASLLASSRPSRRPLALADEDVAALAPPPPRPPAATAAATRRRSTRRHYGPPLVDAGRVWPGASRSRSSLRGVPAGRQAQCRRCPDADGRNPLAPRRLQRTRLLLGEFVNLVSHCLVRRTNQTPGERTWVSSATTNLCHYRRRRRRLGHWDSDAFSDLGLTTTGDSHAMSFGGEYSGVAVPERPRQIHTRQAFSFEGSGDLDDDELDPDEDYPHNWADGRMKVQFSVRGNNCWGCGVVPWCDRIVNEEDESWQTVGVNGWCNEGLTHGNNLPDVNMHGRVVEIEIKNGHAFGGPQLQVCLYLDGTLESTQELEVPLEDFPTIVISGNNGTEVMVQSPQDFATMGRLPRSQWRRCCYARPAASSAPPGRRAFGAAPAGGGGLGAAPAARRAVFGPTAASRGAAPAPAAEALRRHRAAGGGGGAALRRLPAGSAHTPAAGGPRRRRTRAAAPAGGLFGATPATSFVPPPLPASALPLAAASASPPAAASMPAASGFGFGARHVRRCHGQDGIGAPAGQTAAASRRGRRSRHPRWLGYCGSRR